MTKRKKWIFGSIVALIAVSLFSVYYYISTAVPVETEVVALGIPRETISETGTLEAKESAVVSAQNSGEILTISVKEGDEVKKGDQLIAVKSSGEQLKSENARKEEVNSIKAQISGLEKQRQNATDQLSKYKKLLDEGAVSYDVYAQYDVAKSKLDAEISSLQYSIQSLQAYNGVGDTKDEATIDGVITKVYVKQGEAVALGAPIVEISDLNQLYVKTDLIIGDANKVSVGNRVEVYNNEYGFRDETALVEKVAWKAEEKLSELGVMQKRIAVDIMLSKKTNLKIGSDVNIDVITSEKAEGLLMPEKSVFQINEKDAVYLVKDGKAILEFVEIGLKGADYYEVISGKNSNVKEGDFVIISPAKEIENGIRVKI